jgi:hypothetical protein
VPEGVVVRLEVKLLRAWQGVVVPLSPLLDF